MNVYPGPRNALTDVEGLVVGNAEDRECWTGVTVVLADPPALACVDVRGGAPETINTDALLSSGLNNAVHGLVLSGGSAFGLESASALTTWLVAQGRCFRAWGACVPSVVGATIFDLANGGRKDVSYESRYCRLTALAALGGNRHFILGNSGAGFGAVAGTIKGGLGTASAYDERSGVTIAALAVTNSLGSVTMPGSPTFWGWHLEQRHELGGQPPPLVAAGHALETKADIGMNTTLGIVATDAILDTASLQRLAVMAQAGFAYAIRPVSTPFDGDTVFALATSKRPLPAPDDALVRLGAIGADVVARAVMRAVFEAEDLGPHVSYRTRWGRYLRG